MGRTEYAQADGLKIRYYTYGDENKAPMLLVHGWGADARSNWQESGWLDVLAPHRWLIALDVRGHGESDKPHEHAPYGYAQMSADVLAVMDELGIDQADYMGYSMGAFMGAYLLGHRSQRFRSMVLGGIGDESETSAAQGAAIAAALREPDRSSIAEGYGKAVRRYVESQSHYDLQALAFSAEQMWPEGYPLEVGGAGLARASTRVLVVNGAEDRPYVDTADAFVAVLPHARHVRIEGTDHMTTVADARFKTAVSEFLSGWDRA